MPDLYEFWDPNEWELHVYGLLQDRHGALNVVKMPARHKGDHGLDYYSLSNCVTYQCYAVQEPCEVSDRADKQKSKITIDLKKFCSDSVELKRLFKEVQIRRWILVVPLHDSSQVNAHCSTKTAEVKKLGLNYIAPDFEVTIHDLDSFDRGSRDTRLLQMRVVSIPRQPASQQDIQDWSATANPLVATLTEKLRKRTGKSDLQALESDVNEAVRWFLDRENALELLRTNAPQLHEQLANVISRRTDDLKLFGPPANGSPQSILRSELEQLIAEIKGVIPNFSHESASQMARGTIADWLLRCPLDFPPYQHAF
jgi:hypothetical protein